MASPHLRRREARVVDEFRQRKGTQDIHPLRAIQVAEGDPAVIAAAHIATDPATGLLGNHLGVLIQDPRGCHHLQGQLTAKQGDVYFLPFARALSMQQRGQNGIREHHAPNLVRGATQRGAQVVAGHSIHGGVVVVNMTFVEVLQAAERQIQENSEISEEEKKTLIDKLKDLASNSYLANLATSAIWDGAKLLWTLGQQG